MEGLLGRESEVVEGEVWRGWSDLEVRLGWLCSALNKVQICVRGNAFHRKSGLIQARIHNFSEEGKEVYKNPPPP